MRQETSPYRGHWNGVEVNNAVYLTVLAEIQTTPTTYVGGQGAMSETAVHLS